MHCMQLIKMQIFQFCLLLYDCVCVCICVWAYEQVGVPVIVRTAEKGFSVITEYLLQHGALPDLASEVISVCTCTCMYVCVFKINKH